MDSWKKDLSARLARWALILQNFQFSIKHISGTSNVIPYLLSRRSYSYTSTRADGTITAFPDLSTLNVDATPYDSDNHLADFTKAFADAFSIGAAHLHQLSTEETSPHQVHFSTPLSTTFYYDPDSALDHKM